MSSLLNRQSPLTSTKYQQTLLNSLPLNNANFAERLGASLHPSELEIFQINVGKLCNMTCRHCHVDASPDRKEIMTRETIDLCLQALDQTSAHTVDLTGGAPELNPNFRYLVDQCVARGKHVIDRCNLTVLLLPTLQNLPKWFAERGVEIVCSLPHYRQRNTDAQRGDGTFEKSIEALKRLNAVGYGTGDPNRQLTLMSNPVGAFLASGQTKLEQEWKAGLKKYQGVSFDRLITLNNMPISRFLEWLESSGNLQGYMELLVNSFNPATVNGLMCRNTLSISWDGYLYDCDFNQMLDLKCETNHIRSFELANLTNRTVITGRHCFGCTAGSGSSCGGALI
ncbi:MAG: arsenosugar biosynthesis radical SAM protein ArsS [Leptolyngbya sp. UWPOB_LEPTO1]|uniref:arsenosugar biosynthesis radical SAM (seleno)protein ArsS n=1 Tax=Leptolyngbya sp. UWPOB_LEPTO1 TaxID=2815653 RepID=UPI001ACE78B6|nr:arsenosugar biosynthesis radical SAM (seleno)protein ArsS [Leptolyngbya sp. UWPOB_LEPTO1]MBN8560482.1 arsenosugar biosynthesis radical SAM protein ArsS [Leptolyngbya sp. UWPOB_LEPTO1]